VVTDNRNRPVSEIPPFVQQSTEYGETGSVSWKFSNTELFGTERRDRRRSAHEKALEVGADDVREEGDIFEVHCSPPTKSVLPSN
jgi:transcriptional/translational regulatory protein YebC/TACO1